MPEMGQPKEMKELAGMEGHYTVEFKLKADPTKEEWTTTEAECDIKMVMERVGIPLPPQSGA